MQLTFTFRVGTYTVSIVLKVNKRQKQNRHSHK